YYTGEQIQAWAPRDLNPGLWAAKMREIQPYIVELDGQPVGYADLQTNGYIDHFFVSGQHPRRGVGSLLMTHLIAESKLRHIDVLTSDVSRAAQTFYRKFGFEIVEERQLVVRGVVVPNALMCRRAA